MPLLVEKDDALVFMAMLERFDDTVRFLAGYDTQLLTVFPDQSNFFVDDGIIQFMFRLCDLYTPPSSE